VEALAMMTCKEVSTLVSMEGIGEMPLLRRLGVWTHLTMCRHCRAFRRHLRLMTQAAWLVMSDFEQEHGRDFERRILQRLGS
jgi:hypothetical protein